MEASFWNGKRAPGVPDEIDFEEFQNVLEIFEPAFKKYANNPIYTSIGKTISYKELDELSRDFAAFIQHETELKPGDRIAIQLPNSLQYPIALYGAFRAGLIVVNTNPLYTAHEMKHQFSDAGVKALVYMDLFGDRVEDVLKEIDIPYLIQTSLADMQDTPKRQLINASVKYLKKMVPDFSISRALSFRQALKKGSGHNYVPGKVPSRDDIAVLQYTGGTTGVAKGAMLTHGNLVANMLQVDALQEQLDANGVQLHQRGTEIAVAPLPLYHIYTFTMHILCQVNSGDRCVLISNPRDPGMFIRIIKNIPFTAFTGIETLFVGLLHHPKFKECDFSKMKITTAGGAALTEDTRKKWLEITGCDISEGYGLTECSPVVTANAANEHNKPGTVGLPVPGTILKTIDAEGNEMPVGERGELCVKGPQVMKGYWQREEATKESIDEDGWFRTGDVAVIEEDGSVRIVDRLKDMILVSGFNVFPNEIEAVVNSHPDVEYSAVIGVPDQKSGEVPKLFVVAEPDRKDQLTEEAIKAFCKERLTSYKLPKYIEFRDELPMTPVGKILRKALR
ncbi:AMP-binding protein [Pseudomonadales bacterium]|nr:AMP-binding protein [Pseudomonadales bacterium]